MAMLLLGLTHDAPIVSNLFFPQHNPWKTSLFCLEAGKTSQPVPSVDSCYSQQKISIIYSVLKKFQLFDPSKKGFFSLFLALFPVFRLNFFHTFLIALPPFDFIFFYISSHLGFSLFPLPVQIKLSAPPLVTL